MKQHIPIFSHDFLEPYLLSFDLSHVVNINQITDYIINWNESLRNGKLGKFKEEAIKSRFLMEIFGIVLGFNYKNTEKWLYQEELKTDVDGTKPDGVLGRFHISENSINNEIQIVIEVKDAKSNLDKPQNRKAFKITPVDQAFLYASKMGGYCQWIVVTNMEEIRIYAATDQTRYQKYTLPDLLSEEKLKEFIFLFHRDRFFNGESSPTLKLHWFQKQRKQKILAHKNIVDELYYCLYKFDQLSFVNPWLLCNLKPFNVLDNTVWHYEYQHLFTLNPKIYILLENVALEEGNIIIKKKFEETLKKENTIEYQKKLHYIFKKLNQNLINKITAVKDTSVIERYNKGVLGFSLRHIFDVTDSIGLNFHINFSVQEKCECINCTYRTLNFKKIIGNLNDTVGKKEEHTLSIAYGHYLLATDNYKKSYHIYKKLESESKGNDKRCIEYFITKYNLANICHLIFDDAENDGKKKEGRSIDLDRILSEEIEVFIDQDIRKVLLEIKENWVFNRAEKKIAELVVKLKELMLLYKSGGQMFAGPNYVNNLCEEFATLFRYIHSNYIIHDIYEPYKNVVQSVFQGLIYSYQIPDHGIISFPDFYLTEAILYITPDKLKKTLHEVEALSVHDEGRSLLLEKAVVFFKSYYREGIGGGPTRDLDLEKQLISYRFRDLYTNIFSNLCILFRYIQFTDQEFEQTAIGICKFINVDEILSWSDVKHLSLLIKKKGGLFSSKQLLELLSTSINTNRNRHLKYNSLITAISIALRKFHTDIQIANKNIVLQAILNCTINDKITDLTPLVHLWHILSDDNKQILSVTFEEHLDVNFNSDLYEQMLKNNVINFDRKTYLSQLAEIVNKTKQAGYLGSRNGKTHFEDYICYNFLLIPYILNLNFNLPEFKILKNLSDFESWLANPIDFDYERFETDWLKAANNEYILNRMKGNEKITEALSRKLKAEYDKNLAKIYFRYFIQ
ncbi:hypothetical protein SAMN05428949_5536 [Chitinophaga sp. YR627]|uniref:hypothetical protein n=1 Tax=Chitinophaga sp. YR627 TaxID=1881041 RepID=UPI0008EC427B|nr:hypothetical protein [Chitinophaga sp. YR627]SFO51888.1 hypothetical protein SAMN05428949_5536 [Chitinophaga sp. YR627]